jgi:hypothetical protein
MSLPIGRPHKESAMAKPLLSRFARERFFSKVHESPQYNPELEQLMEPLGPEFTGTRVTEARTDPTSDEATDR